VPFSFIKVVVDLVCFCCGGGKEKKSFLSNWSSGPFVIAMDYTGIYDATPCQNKYRRLSPQKYNLNGKIA